MTVPIYSMSKLSKRGARIVFDYGRGLYNSTLLAGIRLLTSGGSFIFFVIGDVLYLQGLHGKCRSGRLWARIRPVCQVGDVMRKKILEMVVHP